MILKHIKSAKALDNYKISIIFTSGESFIFDAKNYISKGIYKSLLPQKKFKKIHINLESRTVIWENGLDISPFVLYDSFLHTKKINVSTFKY